MTQVTTGVTASKCSISLPRHMLMALVCGLISALSTGSVGLGQCWERRVQQCSSKLHYGGNLGNYFFHKVLWFTKVWEFPQSLRVTGEGWEDGAQAVPPAESPTLLCHGAGLQGLPSQACVLQCVSSWSGFGRALHTAAGK